MTHKEETLQNAIKLLVIHDYAAAIDIPTFNGYYKRSIKTDTAIMAKEAADIMKRQHKEKLFEYQDRPTFYNH